MNQQQKKNTDEKANLIKNQEAALKNCATELNNRD